MLNRNKRLVIFTITVLALLVASTFLPASAQLSQWRSLNPIRDGIIGPSGLGPNLYSIHLLSPTVGWAVGGTCDIYGTRSGDGCPGVGYVLSWDGAKWRQVLTPPDTGTLASVFAVSANDVWAVGLDATIIHWDGVSWVTATSPVGTIDIFSVFVLPGGMDGWAVGVDSGAAKILRWSGTWPFGAWSAFTAPASAQELRGVFLLSPTEGWAVGTGGTIFRWDGAGWIDISAGSPTNEDLFSIFALSPTDAWAVGEKAP